MLKWCASLDVIIADRSNSARKHGLRFLSLPCMTMNLIFSYEADDLLELVKAETSRHAGFLRLEGGVSAYDILAVHTNDIPTIRDYISDALRAVVIGFSVTGSRYEETTVNDVDGYKLSFYLPDFPERLTEAVDKEIQRYVELSATSRWLARRSFTEIASQIASDAQGFLADITVILRTRDYPMEDV